MTALLGYGAHGRDIEAIFKRRYPSRTLTIYDDAWIPGVEGVGHLDRFYVGINDPASRGFAVLTHQLRAAEPLLDPTVVLGPHCEIGDGCVVSPNTTLLRQVILGEHTHVNYNAGLTRCVIGKFCTLGPGAVICGDVRIGDGCFIGAGAVVKNLVTIGDDVTVGAGAVVTRDLADGVIVKGVPAR